MSVVWYDNTLENDPDDPDWYDVERIYCLDWDAFSEADWEKLTLLCSLLPEARRIPSDGCPRWFLDVDDPENGYLTASVEPPGLQVFGTLRLGDFEQWHRQFVAHAEGLPWRTLRDPDVV